MSFRHALAVTTMTAAAVVSVALAQKPVTKGAAVSETFTIVAIDHTSRIVTLRGADGTLDEIFAGPEVKRFNELKVGEKVTFRYYESMVFQIRRPGQAAQAPADAAGLVRGQGAKPSGTISQQATATVTIDAVDMKVPSVAFHTEDGRKMSMKVENAKNLEGVKVGDRVEITYTQALAITVE